MRLTRLQRFEPGHKLIEAFGNENDNEFEREESFRDRLYVRDVKFKDSDADILFAGGAGEDVETFLEKFDRVVSSANPQKHYDILLTRITNSTIKDTLRTHAI